MHPLLVIGAAVASAMPIGYFWYGPYLFLDTWFRLNFPGKTMKEVQQVSNHTHSKSLMATMSGQAIAMTIAYVVLRYVPN